MSAGRNENLHGFELNAKKPGGRMRAVNGRMMVLQLAGGFLRGRGMFA